MARLEAVRARRAGARGSSSTPTRAGAPRNTRRSRPTLLRLGVELVEQPLPAGRGRGAGRDGPAAAGLRRRELPRPRRSLPALRGPLRHGQRQARQDRRADRGAGAARRGAGGGLRRDGRLHGRHRRSPWRRRCSWRRARRSPISTGRCCWPRDRDAPAALRRRGACIRAAPGAVGVSMSRIVYVNGDYVPEEEAKISVFDRGFLFADGVYEVTSVLDGKLVDFAGHLRAPAPLARRARHGAPGRRRGAGGDPPRAAWRATRSTRAWSTCRSRAAPATATSPIPTGRGAEPGALHAGARRWPTRPRRATGIRVISDARHPLGRGATSRRCSCSAPSMGKMMAKAAGRGRRLDGRGRLRHRGHLEQRLDRHRRRRDRHARPVARRSCTASPGPRCCDYAARGADAGRGAAVHPRRGAAGGRGLHHLGLDVVTPVVEIDGTR